MRKATGLRFSDDAVEEEEPPGHRMAQVTMLVAARSGRAGILISVSNERFVACLDCAAALALAAFAASLVYAFSDNAYGWLLDAFHQSQNALSALTR